MNKLFYSGKWISRVVGSYLSNENPNFGAYLASIHHFDNSKIECDENLLVHFPIAKATI